MPVGMDRLADLDDPVALPALAALRADRRRGRPAPALAGSRAPRRGDRRRRAASASRRSSARSTRSEPRVAAIVWTAHNVLPHDTAFPDVDVELRRGVVARADIVHVLSEGTVAAAAPLYEIPPGKVLHLPHPAYLGVYPDDVSDADARRTYGLGADDIVFGLVGHLRPYKGLDELLDAFESRGRRAAGRPPSSPADRRDAGRGPVDRGAARASSSAPRRRRRCASHPGRRAVDPAPGQRRHRPAVSVVAELRRVAARAVVRPAGDRRGVTARDRRPSGRTPRSPSSPDDRAALAAALRPRRRPPDARPPGMRPSRPRGGSIPTCSAADSRLPCGSGWASPAIRTAGSRIAAAKVAAAEVAAAEIAAADVAESPPSPCRPSRRPPSPPPSDALAAVVGRLPVAGRTRVVVEERLGDRRPDEARSQRREEPAAQPEPGTARAPGALDRARLADLGPGRRACQRGRIVARISPSRARAGRAPGAPADAAPASASRMLPRGRARCPRAARSPACSGSARGPARRWSAVAGRIGVPAAEEVHGVAPSSAPAGPAYDEVCPCSASDAVSGRRNLNAGWRSG